MSDTTTTTLATFGDNRDTWRFASIACGVLLLISLAAHLGGPSSAHAAPPMNQLAITQQQAQQSLRIGGFTTIDDQPAFIVLNDQGQRIGKLPMNLTPDQGGDGVE